MNESTKTFFFSDVRKRSGDSGSTVLILISKILTLSKKGNLKYSPGSVLMKLFHLI